MLYRWLLYLHVAAVLLFMLSHGVSTSIAFRLRKEREIDRVAALLDLSGASWTVMTIFLLIVLATGITMGILGQWWRTAWFWASLVLFIVIGGVMTPMVATPYNRVRLALGLSLPQPFLRGTAEPPSSPPTAKELEELLSLPYPLASAAIGFGGILVILWLMMFKPF